MCLPKGYHRKRLEFLDTSVGGDREEVPENFLERGSRILAVLLSADQISALGLSLNRVGLKHSTK
jgi:hypothetical protein